MKFKMEFDGDSRRLIITPDNAGEAQLLGGILDPNTIGEASSRTCDLSVQGTNDRPPYKKVVSLTVTL